MARKRKRIRIKAEDVTKNSGKEISHTITKIKKHEKLYTFILVVIFMITISLSFLIGLSSDKYQWYDESLYDSNISLSGRLVALSSKNVMSDAEGLKSDTYDIKFSNNTSNYINYILRFALDEETVERCDCRDQIISFDKIKYSLDGKKVNRFTEETMIITTGMLKAKESDSLKVHIWLDESVEEEECLYYGKFVLEQLEDMDS
ncbi:MAG: hypothetical protein IKF71_04940 [Bacilli bacterium]|nr:hypothetical protein [Bacilli bacterium]